MGIEWHEHQDNEYEDTERNDNPCKPNADDKAEDKNNEISTIMIKQYGTQNKENMRARKQ